MTDTPETPPAPEWREMNIAGFINEIGPLLSMRDGAGWRYGLRTDARHRNPLGIVHGGVIASLLDHAIALTAWSAADRKPTVTVQLDTRFLGAATAGDLLEARATVRHATRSLLFLDAEVSTGGRAVAAASAIMKISDREVR